MKECPWRSFIHFLPVAWAVPRPLTDGLESGKLNFRTEDGEVGGESAIDHKLQGVQGMKWK